METQQFCLKWNSHQMNMLTVFENLLSTEALVDVTLACDGLSLKAHKVVLSACSPYFQSLFVDNPCKHPIVIMKDMRYADLKAIIDFMYKGEVNVSHDQLNALLKTAETLKVKGLAEMSGENRMTSSGVTQSASSSPPPPTNLPVPQTRSDSPALLSKRKHGRPRKRFRSGSANSDEEIVPTKIKEPESPEIEELPQDPSESHTENIPPSSKHQTPIHSSSAAVNSSHLSRKSQSRSSHQTVTEEPSDSDFSIEPSKLLEQTLTTTPVISNGLVQSSTSSGISVNTPSLSVVPTSLSIVPVSCESQLSVATDSHSSNQTQGPDSPQDVKPLLSFEEPLMGIDPSQDGSSFMDSSGVPAIAGTSSSYQEDQTALVPQESQSQGTRVHILKFLSDHLKSSIGTKGYQKSVPLVVLHPVALDKVASSQNVTIRRKSLSESQPLESSASIDSTSGNTPTSVISRDERKKLAKVALNVLSVAGRSKSFHRHKVSKSKFLCDSKYPVSSTSAGPGSGLSSSKSARKRVSTDATAFRKKTQRTPGAVTVAEENEIAQPRRPSTSADPALGLSTPKSFRKRVSTDDTAIRKKTPKTQGAVTVAKKSEIPQPPKPSTCADPDSGLIERRLSADDTRNETTKLPPVTSSSSVSKKSKIFHPQQVSKRKSLGECESLEQLSTSADPALELSSSKSSERRLSADATRKETAKLPPVTSSSVSKKSKVFHPQQVSKRKSSCSESESLKQPSTSADPALGNADSSAISLCASAVSSQAKSPEPSTSAYPTSALNHQELSSHDSQSKSLLVYGAKFSELPPTAVNSATLDESNEFLRLHDDDFPVPSVPIYSTSADEIDPILSLLLDPEPSQLKTGSGLSSPSNVAFVQELQPGGDVGQKIFEDKPMEANCPHCSFFTVDLPGFRKHLMKAHSTSGERKPHRCPLCESEYSGRGSLYSHLMLHTGEKPFVCYKCQKSFAQKCNLENHIKVCRR